MTEIEGYRIYSSKQLNQLGYSSNDLTNMTRQKAMIRLQRGFYVSENLDDQLMAIIQLFPEVILCLNSALYYHGYITAVPAEFAVAVHKNHNRYRYKHSDLPFHAYFRDDKYIDLGVIKRIYNGQTINVYDKERTICDCLRRRSLLSKEEYQTALTAYFADPQKNIERLRHYAAELRISDKIEFLLDVWY